MRGSIFKHFAISWSLLSFDQQLRSKIFLSMMIFGAIFEALGVAAIVPLVEVYSVKNLESIEWFAKIMDNQHLEPNNELFRTILMIALSAFIIFSIFVRLISNYILLKFGLEREYYLSSLVYKKLINKDIRWYYQNTLTDVKRAILSEVNTAVNGGLISYLMLLSHASVAIFIFTILIIVEPKIALLTVVVAFSFYFVIYVCVRPRLSAYGQLRFSSNEERFRAIENAFTNPKVILANQLEIKMFHQFDSAAANYSTSQIVVQIMKQLPRYLIETLAVTLLLMWLIYAEYQNIEEQVFVPTLLVFIFAFYRMLPSIQQVYAAKTQMDASVPSLLMVHSFIHDNTYNASPYSNSAARKKFNSLIKFKNISFSYAGVQVITNLNAEIRQGEVVAVCGVSGSGKTTFLDLCTGLLQPDSGSILVDGVPIEKLDRQAWLSTIAYVTQFSVIFNDTIIENIVLNEGDVSGIDFDRLKLIWEHACLNDFLDYEKCILDTNKITDNGSIFSGGEKQRIMLARALYRDPDFIILDEATNALDSAMQQRFFKNLNEYYRDKTVLIISHQEEVLEIASHRINMSK